VQLTLILTGFNILRDKLGRGISLRQYITSYGDRANDVETVTQCTSIRTTDRKAIEQIYELTSISAVTHRHSYAIFDGLS
jgi:hypothetical protein